MARHNYIKQILLITGGFLCYMIADGCTFSIGILYTEFLEVFHKSEVSIAVLPGLIYAIPQLSAPVVCPIIDTIGSGYGAIIGGIILSISFFVSRFVNTFQVLYVTLGFCASIGLEMAYVSGIMAVTKGFANKNYLGLALGITVSGSGVGVFMFNPLLNYFIQRYDWRGAMLISSAIFSNIIVAGYLFRVASNTRLYTPKKIYNCTKEIPTIEIEVVPDQKINHLIKRNISLSHSAEALDTFNEYNKVGTKIGIYSRFNKGFEGEIKPSVFLTLSHNPEPFHRPISAQTRALSLDRRIYTRENIPTVQLPVDEHAAAFVRRLSLYSSQNMGGSQDIKGSVTNIQDIVSSQPNIATDRVQSTAKGHNDGLLFDHDVHLMSVKSKAPPTQSKRFLADLKRSMLSLISVRVWSNPNIMLFYLSSILFSISVVVVWTFSFSHSTDKSISEGKAALLLSFVGIGACAGQIFFGYISDFVSAVSLYIMGCIFAGVLTIMIGYITVYGWLVLLHILFGFSQGVNYALFSVILLHYSSVELYPASLAIYLLFSGSGNLIGTSFAGYLKDWTGGFVVSFVSGGIMLALSGIIVFPLIFTWQKVKDSS